MEGVRAGLLLALLVGPLFILLIQLSLRRGTLAALTAGLGIWLSDLSFILVTHYGMGGLGSMGAVTGHPYFRPVVGTVGGLLLAGTAVYMWFRRPPDLAEARDIPSRSSLLGPLLQGYALNTFNPFTVTFWSVFTLTQVTERQLGEPAAWSIYGGILLTIVLTDLIKILAARKLRDLLQPKVLLWVQRAGAALLGVFGLVLVVRVWW